MHIAVSYSDASSAPPNFTGAKTGKKLLSETTEGATLLSSSCRLLSMIRTGGPR